MKFLYYVFVFWLIILIRIIICIIDDIMKKDDFIKILLGEKLSILGINYIVNFNYIILEFMLM